MFMHILRSKQKIVFLLNENMQLKKKLRKSKSLQQFLFSGTCNPTIKKLYQELNGLHEDDFPKNSKEMQNIIQVFSFENYKFYVNCLSKSIEETDDVDLKEMLKIKLEKIYELKNLMDLIDENSSKEYRQMITKEIEKAFYKLNEFEQRFFDKDQGDVYGD